MPTYRVPVRVKLQGFIEVEAADPALAEDLANDLDSYGDFRTDTADWVDWEPYGEPKEVEL